jgi:hypothetical protein
MSTKQFKGFFFGYKAKQKEKRNKKKGKRKSLGSREESSHGIVLKQG